MFTCPVCFYDRMEYPPRDFNICECCGTEFGTDDDGRTFDHLRAVWIANGAQWFFEHPPALWNPYTQLFRANAAMALPYYAAIPASDEEESRERLTEGPPQLLAYAA